MDEKPLNIKQDQVDKLRNIFPEAISEGGLDWEELKATLVEDIAFRRSNKNQNSPTDARYRGGV
jgi:hypothetical protein